mmetsp:Transcript_18087/g.42260  ORF Transcript_18087/g.42260 Transcript_18087/m.42260 type:complete len:425 (+) Transcript_18087:106-1380(+)
MKWHHVAFCILGAGILLFAIVRHGPGAPAGLRYTVTVSRDSDCEQSAPTESHPSPAAPAEASPPISLPSAAAPQAAVPPADSDPSALTLTGGVCPVSVNETKCKWSFRKYIPSTLEAEWWKNIDKVGYPGSDVCVFTHQEPYKKWFEKYIAGCDKMNPGHISPGALGPYQSCDCSQGREPAGSVYYDPDVYSRYEYTNDCTGETKYTYIEPLAGLLRHPMTCENYDWLLRKEWLVVDQWSVRKDHRPGSTYYYFDAGAGVWTKMNTIPPSQEWYYALYKGKCVNLDGYWMWERGLNKPEEIFNRVPDSELAKYHYFNVGVVADRNSKYNPLNHIKAVAKPDDYVMFKLDIDNTPIEEGIVHHLLADKEVQGLIDEFFWEHHINMNPVAKKSWFGHAIPSKTGQKDSIKIFRQLREMGIRAHSWI